MSLTAKDCINQSERDDAPGEGDEDEGEERQQSAEHGEGASTKHLRQRSHEDRWR